jgi:hypothetical protein
VRRSLSTGSALLNVIREGAGRSSSAVFASGMTRRAMLVLRELAPRLWSDHSQHLSESDVTVRVCGYPGTLDDSGVRTTFLIVAGSERGTLLTEFWTVQGFRALQLLKGFPVKSVGDLAQEFTVWISPLTTGRVRMPRRVLSFVGSRRKVLAG